MDILTGSFVRPVSTWTAIRSQEVFYVSYRAFVKSVLLSEKVHEKDLQALVLFLVHDTSKVSKSTERLDRARFVIEADFAPEFTKSFAETRKRESDARTQALEAGLKKQKDAHAEKQKKYQFLAEES